MIKLYHIILFINITYILNYFYQPNTSKQYLRKTNNLYDIHNDYEDEFNKVKNKIAIDIYNTISKADNDTFEYKFQINCIQYYDNFLCEEYIQLKYNMTLKQYEDEIIEHMHYFFNNITIIIKNNDNKCCNTYQLYW